MTTVGQLNFFRWFIEKRILEFMTENREAIERDMNTTLKEHYSRSTTTSAVSTTETPMTGGGSAAPSAAPSVTTSAASTLSLDSAARDSVGSAGSRKKRCELTQSAMKKTNLHECEVTISFS